MTQQLNYSVSYILGAIIGDGYLYHHPDPARGAYIIRLRVTQKAFADEFQKQLEKITGKTLRVIPYIAKIKGQSIQAYRVNCWSKYWLMYFQFLSRHLHQLITDTRPDILKGFVRGYIDAEGCIAKESRSLGIQLASTNSYHIECVKEALIKLGYNVNGIYQSQARSGRSLSIIVLKGIYFVHKYADEIGFTDPMKQIRAFSQNYKTTWSEERSLRRFGIGSTL